MLRTFVLLFLLACATLAWAESPRLRGEISVGASMLQELEDGMYYQEGFQHQLRMRAPAVRLVGSYDLLPGAKGLAINASYLYFGRAHIQSDAAPDALDYPNGVGGYNPATNRCNGACGPMRHFDSSGHLHVLALTLEPYVDWHGWRFAVEAGPALQIGTWRATMTVTSPTSPWGDAGRVETLRNADAPRLTYLLGASVTYRQLIARYSYVRVFPGGDGAKNIPLGFNGAHMLTFGYRF